MPYDWKDIAQQQLAGMPNNGQGMQSLSNMPQANMQQGQLRTGNNPNPKFPRLRNAWEQTKTGVGRWGKHQWESVAGTAGGIEQVQNFTPEQQNILQFLQQMGIQGLQDPYAGFEPIAQQALDQFDQEGVNSLAHRFTSLGEAGLDSPDFAANAYGARAGLMKDLAAMKAQYGQQNFNQILQMLQLGLQPQFENIYKKRDPGAIENFGVALAGPLAQQVPGLWEARQLAKAKKDLSPNNEG